MTFQTLAQHLIKTAHSAGRVEMDVYQQGFEVYAKADNSPITIADRAAKKIILDVLAKFTPNIPVVAEEKASEGRAPQTGKSFFLVDPLDGTKEFIRKSNEFTVNIGLVENGKLVFGIVYVPAISKLFFTTSGDEDFLATMSIDESIPEFDKMTLTRLSTLPPHQAGLMLSPANRT
jgi:3'(2'), 5'-bisphosphate nucleotidase